MSILKALQRKRTEDPNLDSMATQNVVPFDKSGRPGNLPPDLFALTEHKIGDSGSAFKGQPDFMIGTALPDLKSDNSAGANLNADSLTRSVVKTLPDFVSWSIDAERVEPRLVAIKSPDSAYCEEYRSLRTQILHKSQRQKLQAIVVASANRNEGKSVTAINLSWLLAQTDGVRCLLIDSDLRMPSVAEYLGIEADTGLSNILVGEAKLSDAIIKLEPSGLHILPGGEARADVAELISGPKFREILRQAREMFDYVIIDAPPLGIFTDATVLINHADGAMLVVRANRTRYTALERILEQIPTDRMMGVVLNQSEDTISGPTYDFGYYNYKRLNDGVSP